MKPAETVTDPVLEELERILASPGFSRNDRLSGFLRYVVQQRLQGKADQLKETVIGTEVFGRKPDYDPRNDPVVRMEAAKLRARLANYYAGAGAVDPIHIEIPKGAYIPIWGAGGTSRSVPRWKWAAAIALPLFFVISGIAFWRWTRPSGKPTIAVLPFVNLSVDAQNDYFSDGLTEEIIQSLSVLEGVDVTSRTSSFALKGARLDIRDIGGKLNATVLLEGSVRSQGDQLRVTAQSIRASDGKHIWSSTYDRQLRDVFAIQEEIAGSIASALRLKFGAGQRHYTDNLEVYDLYLRGRYALSRSLEPGGFAKTALQYFEQAIAKDANYALAYAGAADALLMMDASFLLPHDEAFARAKSAAGKALELDPMLSEAHTTLALIHAREFAWQEAERSLRRAIDLNPNNAQAHQQLGVSVLVPQGRFDEGLGEIRRAVALDPLSPATSTALAGALLGAGRYEGAIDQARKAIALDPTRPGPSFLLGRALYSQGRTAEALAIIQEVARRTENGESTQWLACGYVRAGQRDQALRLLEKNLQGAYRRPTPVRRLANIYACLGDESRAFEYLGKNACGARGGSPPNPPVPGTGRDALGPALRCPATEDRFGSLIRQTFHRPKGASPPLLISDCSRTSSSCWYQPFPPSTAFVDPV